VYTGWAKEWGALEVQRLENLSWKSECTKKKIQGFPHVFQLKNFQNSLKE
jgi:hypothetical protein